MWKSIQNYEGRYKVSDRGLIYSFSSHKLLRPRNKKTYPTVALWGKNKQRNFYIHDLVATHFIGPKPNNKEIHHCDGVKKNNRVSNLKYVTKKEHYRLAIELGQTQQGRKHWNCHLNPKQVLDIFKRAHNGENQRLLGLEFKVSQPHIARIKSKVIWQYLTKAL